MMNRFIPILLQKDTFRSFKPGDAVYISEYIAVSEIISFKSVADNRNKTVIVARQYPTISSHRNHGLGVSTQRYVTCESLEEIEERLNGPL